MKITAVFFPRRARGGDRKRVIVLMNITKHILTLSIAVLALSGCLRDNTSMCPDNSGKILIEVRMPEPVSDTRSASMTQYNSECTISHLDVLVFEDKGGPDDLFMYATTPSEEITNHPEYPLKRTFAMPLLKSPKSEKQRLVLVANLKNEVAALLSAEVPDPETSTKTKEYLLNKLLFSSNESNIWISGNSVVRPLPMWGESENSVLVNTTTTGGRFGTIEMLFSLAKIDIAVNANKTLTTAQGLSNFKLAEIRYYNTRTRSFAAPGDGADYRDGEVHFPSEPSAAQGGGINPDHITWAQGTTAAPIFYAPQFFTHEADNKNSGNDDCVFVLVGGYYTEAGQAENTTDKTWYRMDFYDRESDHPTENRLDILRGHRYLMNITGADGPGYPNVDDAIYSTPMNLDFSVSVWIIGEEEVDFDGKQNYLSVSENEMTIGKDPRTNLRLNVATDVPTGYSIAISDLPESGGNELDWIRLNSDVNGALKFSVDANLTAGSRVAYIHVTAGRLSNVVTVTQLNTQLLSLEVNVEPEFEMNFVNHRGTMSPIPAPAQTLTIMWDPEHLPINITKVATLDQGVNFSINSQYTGAEVDIPIRPSSMSAADVNNDVFREKASRLDIELVGEEGARVMKSVFVRQKSYGVKQLTSLQKYYSLMPSESNTVKIATNSPWKARVTGSAVTSVSPSSGTGNTSGEMLTFRMGSGSNNSTSTVTSKIIIESDHSPALFPPYEMTIQAVWGWVYVTESSKSYHDPTGIYVAAATDVSSSTAIWGDTKCPSNWGVPNINGLRSIRETWGYTAALRTKTGIKTGDYWSSTDEVAGFSKVGMTMEPVKEIVISRFLREKAYARCIRLIDSSTNSNVQ